MSTEPKEAAPMPALVERLRAMYAAAYPDGQHDRTDLGKERFALAFAAVNALPDLLDRIASLEAEVAALRKTQWRSVDADPPENDVRVLFSLARARPVIGVKTWQQGSAPDRLCVDGGMNAPWPYTATHWMPLPDDPDAALDSAIAAKGK